MSAPKKDEKNCPECSKYPLLRPAIYKHIPLEREDLLKVLIETNSVPSVPHSFEGAIHLSFLLIMILSIKSLIETLVTYHYLVNREIASCISEKFMILAPQLAFDLVLSIVPYLLVKLMSASKISITSFQIIYTAYQIGFIYIFTRSKLTPIIFCLGFLMHMAFCLKMHSYCVTNYHLHLSSLKIKIDPLMENSSVSKELHKELMNSQYPNNINFISYIKFISIAPTLVYEPYFVRSKSIRIKYILKELFAAVILFGIVFYLITHFILPVMYQEDSNIIYDILQLCVPSTIIWLIGFYALFHCVLSFAAEIGRYADRQFYLDFWNSKDMAEFWRKWNLPVHEWCYRHIFIDISHFYGISKVHSLVLVFVFSAAAHELIVSIAFGRMKLYFFLIMIAQGPLILLNKKFKYSPRVGNILMWLSLIIGQPLLESLYLREYLKNGNIKMTDFWCKA